MQRGSVFECDIDDVFVLALNLRRGLTLMQ